MANAAEHRLIAAACALVVANARPDPNQHWSSHPATAACIGWGLGTLPDLLEPAHHPNHRQFFHSVVMLGAVGWGIHKLVTWETETVGERIMKNLLIFAGVAYGAHLVRDALTAKSLPLIGR